MILYFYVDERKVVLRDNVSEAVIECPRRETYVLSASVLSRLREIVMRCLTKCVGNPSVLSYVSLCLCEARILPATSLFT